MSFYKSISNYYDYIFPFNSKQLEFVKKFVVKDEEKTFKVLDVGCGTGNLAIELANEGFTVSAIDLDIKMIKQAKRKNKLLEGSVNFEIAGMLEMKNHFKCNHFDLLYCFGNTLPHLNNIMEIEFFLRQAATVMEPGAPLLLQLINYDRILDENIQGLSSIENKHIKFDRHYHYESQSKLIEFSTKLYIKKENKSIENSILLYPLRKKELEAILLRSGFIEIEYFGSFAGSSYNNSSVPLIISCTKKRNLL